MVQAVEHRPRNGPAVSGLRRGQRRIRVGDAVDTLVHAGAVVPVTDELGNQGSQQALVPDEDPVKQLSTQGADKALDMGLSVGCSVGRRDAPDAHDFRKPGVEGGAAGGILAVDLSGDRLSELPEDAVVVV